MKYSTPFVSKTIFGAFHLADCCNVFKEAVRDGFVRKPGTRIPHSYGFAQKYFITRYDEIRDMTLYMYIRHCPNCGKEL